jgi:hypothetical protein
MHGLIDRLNKFRSETKLDTSIDANTGAIVGTPEATGGRSKRWGLSASTCGAKLNRFNKIGFVLHIPSLPSSRGRKPTRAGPRPAAPTLPPSVCLSKPVIEPAIAFRML